MKTEFGCFFANFASNFNGWENWQTSSQLERELRHWNIFPSSVGSALLVSAARVQLFFAFSTSPPTPLKRSVESSLYSHQINILHVLHSLIPDAELIVLPFSFVNFSFPSALGSSSCSPWAQLLVCEQWRKTSENRSIGFLLLGTCIEFKSRDVEARRDYSKVFWCGKSWASGERLSELTHIIHSHVR